MFKVKIKSNYLKETLNSIETIADEIKFKITQNGIFASSTDPAVVAMISLELSKDAFSLFDVTDCEMGIDIKKM